MEEATNFDEYRTGYVAERHDVSDNCARALQLFELGYSTSGAASELGVNESTARSYRRELEETIHPNVTMALAGRGRDGSLDVWGGRDVNDIGNLSYKHGEADAAQIDGRTVPETLVDEKFKEHGINRGIGITEIDTELIEVEH